MTALHVRVAGVQTEAEGVKVFTLESMAAEPLPAFERGARTPSPAIPGKPMPARSACCASATTGFRHGCTTTCR
jgi:hypothetical protein